VRCKGGREGDRGWAILYLGHGANAFWANSRGEFERSYRAALRHSRYVRWLRICVPAGIAALLLTVIGLNYMPPIGGFRLPGELCTLVIHRSRITMQQPRPAGHTVHSRASE